MAHELTVEQKRAANVWDHIDDVLPVIAAARAGKWTPYENMACKYIVLRIDMRDGGCIIKNARGERINPSDLRKQPYGHGAEPWPTERAPLGDWQRETVAALKATDGVADAAILGWLNPDTGKTCSVEEKHSMERYQGLPGITVAKGFRIPLVAADGVQAADPCPHCRPGVVCKKPTCGRLALSGDSSGEVKHG